MRLFDSLVARHFDAMRAAVHVVPGEPDRAVEISEWESAQAREAMSPSEAMAVFAPLFALVAAPPRARGRAPRRTR